MPSPLTPLANPVEVPHAPLLPFSALLACTFYEEGLDVLATAKATDADALALDADGVWGWSCKALFSCLHQKLAGLVCTQVGGGVFGGNWFTS
eukprot:14672642-Ditylum_brightwellii.AAC.1